MSKRVVLTGGTGFVGANLLRRLLGEGHTIHLLLRPEYKSWRIDSVLDHIQLHICQLEVAEDVEQIIQQIKPDWIFHLAVYGAYSYQADLKQMIETNIHGTANLVTACQKVGFEAFVNTGSSSEYGFKTYPPKENDYIDPNSAYAVTKASATHLCRFIARHYRLHIPTVRLYSVYGPYEEPTRLLPTLIVKGLQGELPPLVNPDIARDYVYVDDVCEAYLRAASAKLDDPGAVFNIGTGIQTRLADVVDVACKVLPITREPQWGTMPDRQWDTSVWVANIDTAEHALNWKPEKAFEEGFKLMMEWIKTHPPNYIDHH